MRAEEFHNCINTSPSPFHKSHRTVEELSWVWWFTPVLLALGRLKQEDHEFNASLGYIGRPYLRKKKVKESIR
jgi:hypothetical protein